MLQDCPKSHSVIKIFGNYQGDGMGSMLLNFQVRGGLKALWSY